MGEPGRPFHARGIAPAEVLRQVCGMLKKPGGQLVCNRGSEEDEAGEAVGPYRYHGNLGFYSKRDGEGLPWWSSGSNSTFPMQGPRLDPWSGKYISHVTTKSSHASTKDTACCD